MVLYIEHIYLSGAPGRPLPGINNNLTKTKNKNNTPQRP